MRYIILICLLLAGCEDGPVTKARKERYARFYSWYSANWDECWRAGGKVNTANWDDELMNNHSMRCMIGGTVAWVRDFQ